MGETTLECRSSLSAYLINLPRRNERLRRMEDIRPSCLTYIQVQTFGTTFDAEAFTAHDIASYGYFPWQIESELPAWNRPLKLGEIGCAIAHHLCWSDSQRRDRPYAIILEDDVVFSDDFCVRLQEGLVSLNRDHPDWDLLYLGRLPTQPDRDRVEGFVVPGFSYFTHGYVLSRNGVNKVLSANYLDAIIPVDDFLPALYVDHPRADVRARYPSILSAFAFEPDIVLQLPKEEAGSDTEESQFLATRGEAGWM